MTDETVYHVVPHDGDWAVKEQGVDDPVRILPTRAEAIDHAEGRARSRVPSRVIIHADDGLIERQRAYDEDDYQPRSWAQRLTSPPVLTGIVAAFVAAALVWFAAQRR
ncbi:MAG: DUF2188 domain-containing protein [Rhodothermales bacterium]|nr:DUF2188 domain-containing protein [Rhodothermales bacterium]